MSELFREIEDDIRQEKLDRLWQRFGKLMVGVSLAVILGTVAGVMFENHRQTQAMAKTETLIQGNARLEAKDYKGAIADFSQLAGDGSSPYYGIAMLRKAQAQEAGGDKPGAIKTYQALAAHGGSFGALAGMQAATAANKIIIPDPQSPFYYSQSEWKGWQLLYAGKKDAAVKQFLALRDNAGAPLSLRQRMQDVIGALGGGQAKGKP